jgi:hypothetical protein
VFGRDLLPSAVSSASARIAGQVYGRLVKDLEGSQVTGDGASWLATAREAMLRRLAGGAELGARELREGVAELAGQVSWYEHKPYGAVLHVAPRVLTWLSAAGDVVRGRNAGHWRISRPLWTRMDDWLGAPVTRCEVRQGYAELAGAYLRTFGPVTERDLEWWFGARKTSRPTHAGWAAHDSGSRHSNLIRRCHGRVTVGLDRRTKAAALRPAGRRRGHGRAAGRHHRRPGAAARAFPARA